MITALVLLHTLCGLNLVSVSEALCGASIRWSHNVNIEHVYGMWYGVSYAKHTPDTTDRPVDIGCVTLYISDADEIRYDWRDWTHPRRNYNSDRWLSRKNNPWLDTSLYGSWLDSSMRYKRRAKRHAHPNTGSRFKRNMYGERRLKIIWDEDGQSVEQTYAYTKDDPGLWTVEKWHPAEEREFTSHGEEVWYPDESPRHPDVIRVLALSAQQLIINHCADAGAGGGVFSLILRRAPARLGYREWYELHSQLYSFDLPQVYRKAAVCGACLPVSSGIVLLVLIAIWKLL